MLSNFDWWVWLVALIALVAICILQWQRVKVLLYALMLQAKRMAKDAILQSGQQQEEWVVKQAMQFMPLSLKLFLSEGMVRYIVRLLFEKLKDYADDGQLNGSV
jgi:hypothetical protein